MSEEDQAEQGFDLRGFVDLILHRKWIVVGFTAVLCTLVAIGTALQPKVYEARASVLGGLKSPRLLDFDPIPEDAFRGRDYLETQAAILISRSLIQRAVRILIDEGFYGEIPPEQAESRSTDLAEVLVKKGKVRSLTTHDSQVIQIAVEGVVPKRVARLANAIAEEYVASSLEHKQQMADQAVVWLQTKLKEAEARLRESQGRLRAFEEEHEITTSDPVDRLSTGRFARLNDEYMATYIQRIQLKSRLEALKKASSQTSAAGSPSTTQLLNGEIRRRMRESLQEEYVDGQVQLQALSQRYGEQHPDIITLKARQAKLEQELRELDEPESVTATESATPPTGNLADLEAEYEGLVTKENLLARAMESYKAEDKSLSRVEVAHALLRQDVDLDDKTYNDLLSKLNTARLSGELKAPGVQILDRAEVPSVPFEPRPVRNILAALLLGPALGVGLVILLNMLDRSVKSPQDAAQYLRLPLLTVVPSVALSRGAEKKEGRAELVTIRQPRSQPAECYRNLRTSILFSSGNPVPRTLLVTSAVAGEGKSTTAANLAVVMAQNGRKTLLIDADMRKPALQRYFLREGNRGLNTLLEQGRRTEEAVQASVVENLDLLLCHGTPENPSEMLGSQRMQDLITDLKSRYESIIIDSPVVLSVADAVILAARSEAVIMVHRPGAASRDMVRQARLKLDEVKANILGLVLNNVDAKAASYLYAEHLYYGYGTENDRKFRRKESRKA